MGHIFISYSQKDKAYVHKLQESLQNQDFEVWIDDRIDYGTRWPKVIQEQLDACEAFIVVVSENSYESEWVQNEVARAKRKGKPFFPLLLSGDPWLSVEVTQYVDVKDRSLPPNNFYERIEKFVARKEEKIISQEIRNEQVKYKDFPLPKVPIEIDSQEVANLFRLISDVLDERFKTLEQSGIIVKKNVDETGTYSYRIIHKNKLVYHFSMRRTEYGNRHFAFLDGWSEPIHQDNSATALGEIRASLGDPEPKAYLTNFSLLEGVGISVVLTYQELADGIWAKACDVIESIIKQL